MVRSNITLEARNISKAYQLGMEPVYALRDVSLSLYRGELIAIVGPSGSGKTTLAHVLGGLIRPDAGDVIVGDTPFSSYSDKVLSHYRNKTVGFVFQNFNLLPYYNALENVCVPLVLAKITPRERVRKAKKYLTLLGIENKAMARANELSGGERQRVAIARALIHDPRIIIADEPTGSLDSRRAKETLSILKTLAHHQGVTVVMVTHDLSIAAQADRIIHILDGRIQGETTT
jgi:putative ABC transport system ATP-binding protein